MRPSSRSTTVLILLLLCKLCQSANVTNMKNSKPLFNIFGYLKGFFQGNKINSKYSSRFPWFLPVIVIPVLKQEQTVNIQTVLGTKDREQNAEYMSQESVSNSTNKNTEDNDIEVFRDSTNIEKIKIPTSTSKDLRQLNTDDTTEIQTTDMNTGEVKTTTPVTTSLNMSDTIMLQNSTLNGSYPNSIYGNKLVETITLTTTVQDFSLPPVTDNRWHNFSPIENSSASDVTLNTTEHVTGYPLPDTKGYASAWYSNALIDQLSITTNSYTNNELPTSYKDDGWSHSVAGEFRPLAGLYYDGFLHTPLRKEEFTHRNNLYRSV